jgi:2'-5' RNA ligase
MERLHVTVAFLGEVEPERYPAIVEIGASIGAGRFELLLDRVGYWPRQRIVYAAARELPAPLADLSRALAERVSAACLPTDKRVFVPHVTLLRDAKRAPEGIVFPGMHWEVRALTLVETIRTGRKLAYQQRECWTL